ncbi:MAG TPA: hypothetical protein DCX53_15460 [Anaerolineae bacterium]|nr:hypothetical protein [Anaerolineae bacterium]
MRKLIAFVMVIMVLVTVLGFNVGSASAKPVSPPSSSVPVVVLTSPYFNNLDAGTIVPASVQGKFVGCYVDGNHKVRCVMPRTFAGQNVRINMNIDGTNLNFFVFVPDILEKNHPI